MAAWRTLAAVLISLASARAGGAQTYTLAETTRAGDCFRIHLELALAGEMRVTRDGKRVPLKLMATAVHDFPERVLNVGPNQLPDRTARVYEQARAVITVNGDRSERTLRGERRLCVAQRHDEQPLLYSPAGPLTREELELTGEHFDTLALTGLLPGKAVAVGDTWSLSNAVAQALCNFEGLTDQDLVCKLEAVQGQTARVSVTGTASGIDLGALTKLTVDATYQYDLGTKRLTRLEWKQKDARDQGPANPATAVESTTVLTRTAIEQPASLSDVALVSVPDDYQPPPAAVQLEYHDTQGRFALIYGREWQTVSQSEDHLVLRLMERGDFVAQATVTPWTKADKGKHLTPDEFREVMADTPGWQPEDELQAGEVPADGGRWIYRISAVGQLDGAKVMQNFYLVAGPDGDQVVLVFTLTPKQVNALGTRDISLAANLDFPRSRKAADKSR